MSSRGRRWQPTLGQWLALLVIVFFVVPLCVVTLWGYMTSRRHLTDAAFRNIRNVAALEAAETLEFMRGIEALIPSIIAGNEHLFEIARALQSELGEPDRSARERALRSHLQSKVHESGSAERFTVLSAQGRVLASSDPSIPVGEDRAQSRCFLKGAQQRSIAGFEYERGGGHDHSSPQGDDDGGDSPRVIISAPIRDADDEFLGVFCGRFVFDVHRSLLLARTQRTSQATLFLLDDENRIMCGSFEDIHGAPFGDRFDDLPAAVLALREPWEGRYEVAHTGHGDHEHSQSGGEEVMIAYAPIAVMGWGIVVEVPVRKALASIDRLKWQAVIASVALVLVLGVAVFTTWRKVVQPVYALSRTSDRMASGASGETVVPSGPREIAELGSAFNRMSIALRDSQDTLEERIVERTRALQESQEFTELLLNSIEQRVTVIDSSFSIVKANAAAERMSGRPLTGVKCYEVFEGRSSPCDRCPAARTFETGQPAADERSQLTADGQEAIHVETYPVRGADAEVASVVIIGRVVTDEMRIQMQMVHHEKMAAFGLLAAGVAHEIGNPLASIESQLRLAETNPDRAEQTMGVVRKEVARIGRLLRELVDFSRRRRDTEMLVSANQAVEDVTRLIAHDPRARNVEFEYKLAEGLPGIRAVEDHLVQVLMNLGLNALDAMPRGGSLTFETSQDDGKVVVRVRDTGTGIPEHCRSRLFEAFFTTKGPGRGTGLGLFVSRGIVEGMGGSLELEDTGPDGTTFVIRLDGERA